LATPVPLLDEPQRQAFKEFGLVFPTSADLLADEMLLFYRVVTRARRGLVLSYTAVDDKGQELLPSSFLSTVRDCFAPGAIAEQSRRMLIEGYDRDLPLSAAEYRVQWAVGSLQSEKGKTGEGEKGRAEVSPSPLLPFSHSLPPTAHGLLPTPDCAANLAAA